MNEQQYNIEMTKSTEVKKKKKKWKILKKNF